MNSGKTVFAQILQHISRYEFNKCVTKYNGNHRIRAFPCYDQFLCLAFAQLVRPEKQDFTRFVVTLLFNNCRKLWKLGFSL